MGVNAIPAYVSSTGTLPGGLSTGTIYCLGLYGTAGQLLADSKAMNFNSYCNGGTMGTGGTGLVMLTSNGSGTISATPVAAIYQFNRIQFADTRGRYLFFEGGGDISAETTLREEPNQTYLQKSKIIPPYNLNYQGVSNGGTPGGATTINDTSYTGAQFKATISNGSGGPGTQMTVSAVANNGSLINVGETITSGAAAGTVILAQASGTAGSTGNYTVSISQNVSSATSMTAFYTWFPYSIGHLSQFQGNTGDNVSSHGELGPIPNEGAIDYFNQSLASELTSRATGLSAGLTAYDFRDDSCVNNSSNTCEVMNLAGPDNPKGDSYRGMPSTTYNTLSWGGDSINGIGGFTRHPL